MVWLNVLVALLKVAGGLTDYLQQRKIIEGAQAQVALKSLEAALDAIEKSNKARKSAADKFDAGGGVPDPIDPNLRD